MNFNRHFELEGLHAFLGPSKYHWLNYSEEKMADSYLNFLAAQRGTELHAFAAQCIRLGQKLPKSQKTLNMCLAWENIWNGMVTRTGCRLCCAITVV